MTVSGHISSRKKIAQVIEKVLATFGNIICIGGMCTLMKI